MLRKRQNVLWALRKTKLFKTKLFNNIIQAKIVSEKHTKQQVERLKYKLSRQTFSTPSLSDSSSSAQLDPTTCAPDAFRFVSLNATTSLYTKCAPNGRPYQVWLYDHDRYSHGMLFEESSPSCTVDVALTRDGEYVTINSNTRTSSEVSIVKSHDLVQKSHDISRLPVLLRPRQESVEYYVEHAHSQFYIFTNMNHNKEYMLMMAKNQTHDTWMDYYQPQDGVVLQDVEFFDQAIVLYGLKELVPMVIVIDPNHKDKEPLVLSGEDYTHIDKSVCEDEEGLSLLHDYKSDCWPVWFSSPVRPPSLFTISHDNKITIYDSNRQMDSKNYCIQRVHAASKDGVDVPMTLCYHSDMVKKDNSNPVLVHVYGSYGENVYSGYQPEKEALLSRGWVLVYCHVRGGGEKGRGWYHGGMGENKHKTFVDLHACVRELHAGLRLSQPRLTAMTGRSAGGLAVGMFCNIWPHLLQAAILQVPLVNLMSCLSDSSLYLSSKDYLEFGGNPLVSDSERAHISSICPYSCLKPQDYPAMFISAAKNDDVIPFDGVEKYVSKLKESIANYHKNSKTCHSDTNPNDYLLVDKLADRVLEKSSVWRFLHRKNVNRGTVVFKVDHLYGHYGSGNLHVKSDEASIQDVFLHKALQLDLD